MKYRQVTGVIWDPQIPIKITGKVFKIVVRPVIDLNVGGSLRVVPMIEKLRSKSLAWHGYVMRRDEPHVTSILVMSEIQGRG